MIVFDKMLKLMKEKEITKYYLRTAEEIKINGTMLDKLIKTGEFGSKTINKLCKALDCQPGDIMEYVPDQDQTPEQEK